MTRMLHSFSQSNYEEQNFKSNFTETMKNGLENSHNRDKVKVSQTVLFLVKKNIKVIWSNYEEKRYLPLLIQLFKSHFISRQSQMHIILLSQEVYQLW